MNHLDGGNKVSSDSLVEIQDVRDFLVIPKMNLSFSCWDVVEIRVGMRKAKSELKELGTASKVWKPRCDI